MVEETLLHTGWSLFPAERAVADWAAAARIAALDAMRDPAEQARWLRCGGTWFVGVDTLPNDPDGAVAQGGPLQGRALDAARGLYGDLPLHRGQVSVCYPGYPLPSRDESDAAFRYRRNRDSAHVDGLLAVGAERRRMLKERHTYILGLPLTETAGGASPMVVWEGSHHIMRDMFVRALGDRPEANWADTDVTEIYQATRRQVFETCRRVEITASPGQAYLVHRFALHGVAPWADGASAPPEGRMIAYFRPELTSGRRDWLDLP